DLLETIDRLFATTEKLLREQLGQAKTALGEQIVEVQRNLYDAVPRQVRDNLQDAFKRAAEQKGTGMKARMLSILVREAQTISATMFRDARESLLAGVRQLND